MANVREEMERDVRISGGSLKTVALLTIVKYEMLTFFPSFFHETRSTQDLLVGSKSAQRT